jgi:hypothetical protein
MLKLPSPAVKPETQYGFKFSGNKRDSRKIGLIFKKFKFTLELIPLFKAA